jgi:hypothetical protein
MTTNVISGMLNKGCFSSRNVDQNEVPSRSRKKYKYIKAPYGFTPP